MSPLPPPTPLGDPSVLAHVTDVHCHPTDSPISQSDFAALPIKVCAMSTRASDQPLVRRLALDHPDKVTPSFGYHPWFTHWISLTTPAPSKHPHYSSLFSPSTPDSQQAFDKLLPYLPDPIPLSTVLTTLRKDLSDFPNAMLGEVGLDRACRVPFSAPSPPPYADERQGRELSPFTIPLEHQLGVLEAQLGVAVEMRRNVSLHSVKCQQATVDLLARMQARYGREWARISVDMHSCGVSAQTWTDIEKKHTNVFLSLSTAINARSPAHRALIAACSPHRILVESDFHDVRLSTPYTWTILHTVAEVKGWKVEEVWNDDEEEDNWGAVRRLEENWKAFVRGRHEPAKKKRDKKRLVLDDSESDDEGV